MVSDLSLLHRETSPLFKSVKAEKKVNMFLFKLSFFLLRNERFDSFEGLCANVVKFVLSQAQRLGNGVLSSKFARKYSLLHRSEANKQYGCANLLCLIQFHPLVFH